MDIIVKTACFSTVWKAVCTVDAFASVKADGKHPSEMAISSQWLTPLWEKYIPFGAGWDGANVKAAALVRPGRYGKVIVSARRKGGNPNFSEGYAWDRVFTLNALFIERCEIWRVTAVAIEKVSGRTEETYLLQHGVRDSEWSRVYHGLKVRLDAPQEGIIIF